jgi:HSP20 family molecular chaperone IbpA
MWKQAEDLLQEAEKIRLGFLESAAAVRSDPSWGPPVNVIETEESLWIVTALPGVEAEQIEIRIADEWLIITGQRTLPEELRRGRLHIFESPSGPFERRLRLPQRCKFQMGEKSLSKGMLFIQLRKLI